MSKKALPPQDDGRVIAPMNVPGMPWYDERRHNARQKPSQAQTEPLRLTVRERWAIIKAAYASLLPILLVYGLGFFGVMLLIQWWLTRA